jgi:hypothetical protein
LLRFSFLALCALSSLALALAASRCSDLVGFWFNLAPF